MFINCWLDLMAGNGLSLSQSMTSEVREQEAEPRRPAHFMRVGQRRSGDF